MRGLKNTAWVLALFSGVATAAPYTWTIPSTLLTDGTSISGTFTFDKSTAKLSSVNIVKTGSPKITYKTSAAVSGGYIRAQADVSDPSYIQGVYLDVSAMPIAGGTYTASIGVGRCVTARGDIVAGICQNISTGPDGTLPYVTTSSVLHGVPATPATVPTLGEYALAALAALMALVGFWTMRQRERDWSAAG